MTILTALDPSKPHDALLNYIQKLCKKSEANLYLLCIVPFPEKMVQDALHPAGGAVSTKLVGVIEALELHKAKLQEVAQRMKSAHFEVHELIAGGEIVETILAKSREIKADLLVLERHPHHIISAVLGGNTALAIARRSEVPVLLYPA